MLAELAEADAPPEIASIYAEMRHTTGAPMVALIWRHLATMPGVLAEVWRGLGPLYRSGRLQDAAWRAAAVNVQAAPADVGRARLIAAGLDDSGIAAFERVLEAYNRVNPVNFIAVRALLHAMRGSAAGGHVNAMPPWTPPDPVGALPAMAPISAIAGEPRRLIDALSSNPGQDRSTVVPTLYRHLTDWPTLIPLVHEALIERFQSGEIAHEIRRVADAIDGEAQRLASMLPPLDQLKARPEVMAVLDRFSLIIPEMIVVGLLLQRGVKA